ncbi:hypothetical protein [Planomonospora parontospora]|uniref:hypothetical protein n=1 Tax=Planomonospora parontospora TaxID=58119 RepID=UPI0016708030|nr:hypothetical protein [Planomonospora parontospora]GGL48382.1 hypothetical protein GCM10014719_57070 [Planomonospora parontospora subsp. antibiotica]GII18750.1 hypothetical protein Ppa05_54760 [Planomonospora parontospora subsp. antibiotica]
MPRPDLSEPEYLRHIEHLARKIVNAASAEGWLTYADDPAEATPLQRMVNETARQLRHYHFDGDGCLDEERPFLRLAGAVLLQPQAVPLGMEESYPEICARLGVEARPEGWAIWNTWAADGQSLSMILADSGGTEGLLMNWARGIEIYPLTPLSAQVVLTRQGWLTPMTLSPRSARRLGAIQPVSGKAAAKPEASGGGTPAPG